MNEARNVTLDPKTGFPPKEAWGPGPWTEEPDCLEFVHKGIPCLLQRGPSGAWCGYAAAPPGHPWHGRIADEVPAEVHGGPTYAAPCKGVICHVPAPGEPDNVWWIGFDCAHFMDLAPGLEALRPKDFPPRVRGAGYEDTYRTLEYVKAETEALAEQILKTGVAT